MSQFSVKLDKHTQFGKYKKKGGVKEIMFDLFIVFSKIAARGFLILLVVLLMFLVYEYLDYFRTAQRIKKKSAKVITHIDRRI